MRNTNDGISVVQTAEGATSEVGNILKRMRELAVQSSSETLESTERQYIQDEYSALASEVDRIAEVTEFNGLKLTNNDNSSLAIHVGVNNTANDRINHHGRPHGFNLGGGRWMSLNSAGSAQADHHDRFCAEYRQWLSLRWCCPKPAD